MIRIILAALLTGVAVTATAQVASQRPIVVKEQPAARIAGGERVEGGAYQPTPAEIERAKNAPPSNIGASYDQKGWIATIDGKGREGGMYASGVQFSLGSEHVLRGKGFDGFVSAFLTGMRQVGRRGVGHTVGSVLTPVRQSDTELVLRVTQIRAGQVPWSASQHYQDKHTRLKIRTAGGARQIEAYLLNSPYRCTDGEPNCAP